MKLDPKCACGTSRTLSEGYLYCQNCDKLQESELLGVQRQTTAQDHKYKLAMTRRESEWYKK